MIPTRLVDSWCLMIYRLERSTVIARPRYEVFRFFADARNLERITPSFLRFHILTPAPIVMGAGTLIDYELHLYGMPVRWRTLIEEFAPERSFTDVQVRGPYRTWRHRHEFEESSSGTEMRDLVEYEMPLGAFGRIARSLFVRSSLDRIFDHRNASIKQHLQAAD
jgi:ligand-binding SRPBCC domain-containing protein